MADSARTRVSLPKWFRILDHNADGYICRHDLKFFIEAKNRQVGVRHAQCFDSLWQQVMDIMPRLRAEGRIAANDPQLKRSGHLLFDICCAADPASLSWNGYI